MKRLLAILILGLFLSPGTAHAAAILTPTGPVVTLEMDGQNLGLPYRWASADGKHWILESFVDPTEVSPIQFLTATANSDPFLNFAVGFINPFPAPTIFVLTLLVPYVGGPYNQSTLSFASTATDGGGPLGATLLLNTDPHIGNALVDAVAVTGLSTGCAITPPPDSQSCFSGADSTVGVATLPAGFFGVRINFMLSPNDSFSASGQHDLTNAAVPEPATVLLIGTGLVAALRRRFVN
jgi:hypothetical protein